jgi:glycerophosphoryl diester phosphodiesterase
LILEQGSDVARLRAVGGMPRIYAHRGASTDALENTMPAFEAALASGADGIELDVRLSQDGEVMVFHDVTLERLAERKERIGDLSAHALAQVVLKRDARIPKLDDVLDLLAGKGRLLNIEIKGDGGRRFRLATRVSERLRRRSANDRRGVMVSSFRPEVLLYLRALQPALPGGFLFDAENTGPRRSQILELAGRFSLVHPQFRMVDATSMARWKAAQKVVNVWTVDAPDELSRLAGLGVDGIITNDPAGARQVLSAGNHCRGQVRGL